MPKPYFSVIIVNYNGGAYLRDCLLALCAQSYRNFEILLVDNASNDNSLEIVTEFDNVQIFAQSQNLGFAAANNLAAYVAKGDYLVLLNPDTKAMPDWLEALADATRQYPDIAMFASTQINMQDPGKLDGVCDAYSIFGIPWRGGYGWPVSKQPRNGYCFSPCGAGAMFRRSIFLQVGGFDESLFCYCEDIDLGFRLRLIGYECLYLASAKLYHASGGISPRTGAFATYHGVRNRLWVYLKNMPILLLMITLPFHIVLTCILLGKYGFSARLKPACQGLKDALKGLIQIWNCRSERTIPLKQLIKSFSLSPIPLITRSPHIWPISR